MTFEDAKNDMIKQAELELNEIREEQIKKMNVMLKAKDNFNYALLLPILNISRGENDFIVLHNAINKLKKLNLIKIESEYRKKLPNGEFSSLRTIKHQDMKTDAKWMETKECTKEQMEQIFKSIIYNDKKQFFKQLLKIVGHKELTHSYTKLIFGSSVQRK